MKQQEKRGKRQTKGRKKASAAGRSRRPRAGKPCDAASAAGTSPRAGCPRICANCACGMRPVGHWQRIIMSRWPGLLICLDHPEAPGQMKEVAYNGTCRNFRPRPAPAVRLEPPEPPNNKARFIPLTQGKFALVDADDYEWLSQYRWQATFTGAKWYACSSRKGRTIWMHRLIMNAPNGMVVDHVDGNGLHNCRFNLRVCTREQNAYNSRRTSGTSRFKGVHFERASGGWRATISFKGEHFNLGLYDDEVEAARAYDHKAIELFGEFAYLNFPEEHGRDARVSNDHLCGKASTGRPCVG